MFLLALAVCGFSRVHRVLAVVDDNKSKKVYSLFFADLESLGSTITYRECGSSLVQLERFGERVFDTVVVLTGKSSCFGPFAEELTRFLDNGGNAYVFASRNKTAEVQDRLYRHFGLRVTATGRIIDVKGNTEVVLRNFLAPPAIVSRPPAPLLFDGGFGTIDRPNDFRIPIVSGGLEHVATGTAANAQVFAYDIIPIYALQGRTGGRVVFVHSHNFASDDFFGSNVTLDANLTELESPLPNGNRQLLQELSEYVTHYKSDVHIKSADHFASETGVAPVQYHIKQNVTVVAELEAVKDGEWLPYNDLDVQVEIFMLGTFIRRHMKLVGPGKYTETIMLPDRAGNFKIKVFTDKQGWYNAREEMAIAIRPLAIREKEKFLPCAAPYQWSMILVMIAAFLASLHFLYHRPSPSQQTESTAD
jgi:hypothetical protein